MSFQGSPIMAGPERPSAERQFFISITLFLCYFFILLFFLIISSYSTTLSPGADWWIIDKPPEF